MSVCDVPVIAAVCDAVGEGTASLIAAPFDWLAYAMGSAAAWLFEAVWSAFDTHDARRHHRTRDTSTSSTSCSGSPCSSRWSSSACS